MSSDWIVSESTIAGRVMLLLGDCLAPLPTDQGTTVEGIVHKYVFLPERIEANKEAIRALLDEMPLPFHAGGGGGWSFLNLCVDKDGVQWGEHSHMEALCCLAIAAKLGGWSLPRTMWEVLPGGMPYVGFDTRKKEVV